MKKPRSSLLQDRIDIERPLEIMVFQTFLKLGDGPA